MMPRLIAALVFAYVGVSVTQVHAENYNAVLAVLQNSTWHGSFTSGPAGVPTCHGTIDVRFFPMRKESFAGGAQTVSYRHIPHFSVVTPFMPFCETIGTAMSAVNVAGCEKHVLTQKTVENGRSVSVSVRTLIARDFSNAFQDVDAIVAPVSPFPAFKLGEKVDDPLAMYLSDIFTITGSLAGIPCMSVPCGNTAQGLPVGMQILTKHFDETTMFRLAGAFENVQRKQ